MAVPWLLLVAGSSNPAPPPAPPPPECPIGRVYSDGLCVQCERGSYTQGLVCAACSDIDPYLTTAGVGATSTADCICSNADFIRVEDPSDPTDIRCLCAAGQYVCEECDRCEPCPQGFYSSTPGAEVSCTSCSEFDSYLSTASTGASAFSQCVCSHSTFVRSDTDEGVRCLCPPGRKFDAVNGRCPVCPEGTYKATLGNSGCLDCSTDLLGTIGADAVGESSLAECVCGDASFETLLDAAGHVVACICPAGMELSDNGKACVDCPAGTYKDSASMDDCRDCPAGTYRNALPATSCVPCPAGFYNPSKGKGACTKWCDGGTFSPPGSKTCYSCGNRSLSDGGDCADGVFGGSKEGFWAAEVKGGKAVDEGDGDEVETLVFHECPEAWACAGGLRSACAGGRTGALCSRCPHVSYMALDGRCAACAVRGMFPVWALALGVAAVALVVGMALRWGLWLRAYLLARDESEEAMQRRRMSTGATPRYGDDGAAPSSQGRLLPSPGPWAQCVERCRILFVYVQLLGTLTLYRASWPPLFGAVVSALEPLAGRFRFLGIGCAAREDTLHARVALVQTAVVMLLFTTTRGLGRVHERYNWSVRFDGSLATARHVVGFVATPGVCLLCAQLLVCRRLGSRWLVAADVFLSCEGAERSAFVGMAIAFLALQALGQPGLILVSLLKAQRWPHLPWESPDEKLRSVVGNGMASQPGRLRRNSSLRRLFDSMHGDQKPLLDHLGGVLLAIRHRMGRDGVPGRVGGRGLRSRRARLQTPTVRRAHGFCFKAFRLEVWWWELVDIARKVLLFAAVHAVGPGTLVQLAFAFAVTGAYAIAMATHQPYEAGVDQRVAQACNICLCALLAIGMHQVPSTAAHLSPAVADAVSMTLALVPFVAAVSPPFVRALAAWVQARIAQSRARYRRASGVGPVPETGSVPASRLGSLAAGATSLTAREIAEAEDALDAFLMEDAAYIWRRSAEDGSAFENPRRMSTTLRDLSPDHVFPGSPRSTVASSPRGAGGTTGDKDYEPEGSGRFRRTTPASEEEDEEEGGPNTAAIEAPPRPRSLPPVRLGRGSIQEQSGSPGSYGRGPRKSDMSWRYSTASVSDSEGLPNLTQLPPASPQRLRLGRKSDLNWRFSVDVASPAPSPAKPRSHARATRGSRKSDVSWGYSTARRSSTDSSDEEGERSRPRAPSPPRGPSSHSPHRAGQRRWQPAQAGLTEG